MYHLQLSFLKEMFQENCYPENFISLICFEQNLYHKRKASYSWKEASAIIPSLFRNIFSAN